MACLDVLLRRLGTNRTDPPRAFCPRRVTQPIALHAPSFAPKIFRTGAWSSANPNRDLPVCPLWALTPAGVAFFTDSQHMDSWMPTDRQAGRLSLNC